MRLFLGAAAGAALLLSSAIAAATPVFETPESYVPYYGSGDGAIDALWDSPVVGKHGTNRLDLIYRDYATCVARPSYDVPTTGWGCGGQCVELTSRWLALYVNYTHTDDASWVLGDGGDGYCSCAEGQCGQDASLYEVRTAGDRTTPRLGDVLSFSYVHAAIATHVWADDGGIHIGLANQNLTMTTVTPWYGDHFGSESCLVHPVEMPQFDQVPRYAADIDGDGIGDVCGRASDGIHCRLGGKDGFGEDIVGPGWADSGGWWRPRYDATIQFPDVDGDGKADVCARDAKGIVCDLSTGHGFGAEITGPNWSDAAGWTKPQYYSTIRFPDVNGDGRADVCGRAGDGIHCALSTGTGFGPDFAGPSLSDASGWDQAPYVATIQYGDVDGDGKDDVCARGVSGVSCWLSDGNGFPTKIDGPAWSDHNGWGRDEYYETIQLVDIDGDGKADLCGRASGGVVCQLSTGHGFGPALDGPSWSDASGWTAPRYWHTIQFADIDGNGTLDVCGRGADGMHCTLFDGHAFGASVTGPSWSDADGWDAPQYYMTIAASDVNGDGRADLCARDASGVTCALSTGDGFATETPGPTWSDKSGWNGLRYYGTIRFPGIPRVREHAAGGIAPVRGKTTTQESGGIEGDSGCACNTTGRSGSKRTWTLAVFAAMVMARRRRRR